jgi:hypothetical protein
MLTTLGQGDTITVIGVLRSYNRELYIMPEIIKKADPRYLLVRKLELEGGKAKSASPNTGSTANSAGQVVSLRDQIIEIIKSAGDSGGVSTESIILKIQSSPPEAINSEITKLLEDGMIYEPRPSMVRWLG